MHERGKTSSGNSLRRQGTVSKDRMVKVPGAHTDDRWKGKEVYGRICESKPAS